MEVVYFFRENGSDFVKIGRSKEYKNRFEAFKTYAANGAYIVGFIWCSDSTMLEKRIHNQLKEFRVNGEFFKIDDHAVKRVIKDNHIEPNEELIRKMHDLCHIYKISEHQLISFMKKISVYGKLTANRIPNTPESLIIAGKFKDIITQEVITNDEFRQILEYKYNEKITKKVAGMALKYMGYVAKTVNEKNNVYRAWFKVK